MLELLIMKHLSITTTHLQDLRRSESFENRGKNATQEVQQEDELAVEEGEGHFLTVFPPALEVPTSPHPLQFHRPEGRSIPRLRQCGHESGAITVLYGVGKDFPGMGP
jgi:hypothetical protein